MVKRMVSPLTQRTYSCQQETQVQRFACCTYGFEVFFCVRHCLEDTYIIQVNEKFYKLERVYRDCIKMTRDKTRIYSIMHDAPGA